MAGEAPGPRDWLRAPLAGRFLRWRHARLAMQVPLFAIASLMVAHGLFGPQLAPRNAATLMTWIHFRGGLLIAILLAGNLFCMACPFMLPREIARRFLKPAFHWPRRLRSKWLSLVLFALVLFAYELYDLWDSPRWTAALILVYFTGALAVDGLFKKASFCKWVCPIGQLNFIASTLSPLEVQVRDADLCARCETLDCITGHREGEKVSQRGCELMLFLPEKKGNMDCTFCLDCAHACPQGNVALESRLPGSELWTDPRRSGVGLFSQRRDLAALVVVFTFGALLNAFGMVSPIYAVESWLAARLGTVHEAPVLAAIFALVLIAEPALLLGLAAWLTRRTVAPRTALLPLATRFSYSLVPLGVGIWMAHYSFHLLTSLLTFIPVTQSAFADFGLPILGRPAWQLGGLSPGWAHPLELGFLGLGLLGSLLVAWRIAGREAPLRTLAAFLPWAGLCLLLWGAAIWLMGQPMEMRGTMGGL